MQIQVVVASASSRIREALNSEELEIYLWWCMVDGGGVQQSTQYLLQQRAPPPSD